LFNLRATADADRNGHTGIDLSAAGIIEMHL
jgi:hypothetical protein